MEECSMDRVYAFTDEYGGFGWNLVNPTVSSNYIITAIIVKESDLETFTVQSEAIRKKYFQAGEMKSSKVGKNHRRRQLILNALMPLPFKIFSVCIDKRLCLENMNAQGLKYKTSFYKFMNNIVHKELRRAFQTITIIADEIGGSDYMKSFCKYVANHQDIPNLWGDADFSFSVSRSDSRIQVADFISGTLAYIYDSGKKSAESPDYLHLLRSKIMRIEQYPKIYSDYVLEDSATAEDYDEPIAKLCFAQAVHFIEKNESSDDIEVQAQIIVLKYLLFRFMNNSTRGYIYTSELKGQLESTEMGHISDQVFRNKIIGRLRDSGVIIASSQKGYKIPSKQRELYDYVNHDAKIVIPMLARLKRCRDLVKLATLNEVDLLDHDEYSQLRSFFDSSC